MRYFFYTIIILAFIGFSSNAFSKEGGEEGANPEFSYVDIPPIAIPVVDDNGVLKQQLSLSISIEIETLTPEGMKNFEEIDHIKPRLTDAYIQDLYGAVRLGNSFLIGHIIDVTKIKKRLEKVTEKVLGEEHPVHKVLVKELHQIAF